MKYLYLPLFCALAACGTPSASANLASELDTAQTHLSALQSEYSRHATAMQGAGTLADILREEDNHQSAMIGHLDIVRDEMGNMGQMCHHMQGGTGLDTRSAEGTLQEMRTQCQAHHDEVVKSADPASARGVEDQHGPLMQSMFDMMGQDMTMMQNEAGQFYCSGMHGM